VSAQVERDPAGALGAAGPAVVAAPAAPLAVAFDPEIESAPQLPSDHPAWARDRLALTMRARELVAKLKPAAVLIRTFWDHHVRSMTIGRFRLSVDASGSYRLE
jgi:hypothetical protein